MAGGTLRIDPPDLASQVVRLVPCSHFMGKTAWMVMDVGSIGLLFGDYDADCVTVARALAAQLTKAADDLDALLAAKPAPEPSQAEHQQHQSPARSDAAVEKTGESPIPAPDVTVAEMEIF